jgi:DNA gyrase subunit A
MASKSRSSKSSSSNAPTSKQDELFQPDFAREIIDIPVTQEMSESFLSYSLSVITSRAIPDVRDGLKPVQRRILHSMSGMGLRPDRPHRKCAGVVGETMGKYHPHGDGAIYDALTRMGQEFGRRITLVDPHGNFGSLDDPPAAYRYTECRMTPAALELLGEIDEGTVDFRPTFDGERDEPVYLPARLPNLLVNGTSGIAVGMATNMPTHNLREVAKAIQLVMKKRRPKPTMKELMKVLPGPDFPTGGVIIDDGLADAYVTGRGTFRIRSKAEIESVKRTKRQRIVVTELPYMVGPERVMARIDELVGQGKIVGIADGGVKNLSDRHNGLNLTIECKPGVNAAGLLTELYRQTPLEESFGINNVVLVEGVPTTVGLWDLCNLYIDHRLDVVVRRTEYRLTKAQDRLHIVEGLLKALDAIDEVVAIIRSSQDPTEARERLMAELALSEIQATHILDMQLRRLTALEKLKLDGEAEELSGKIADYKKLLGSEQRRRTLVLKELDDLVAEFGDERRSKIIRPSDIDDVSLEAMIDDPDVIDEPCVIALSTSGVVGREPTTGPRQAAFGRHDVLWSRTLTTTGSPIAAITSHGRALIATAAQVAEVSGRSRGVSVSEIFTTQKGEVVLAVVAQSAEGSDLLSSSDDGPVPMMLITERGVAKRVSIAEVLDTANGKTVIKLKPGDHLVAAFAAADDGEAIAVSSNAQALRFPVDKVSIQGRGAGGVAGMKLAEGATVVGAGPVDGDDAIVLTQTDKQTAKVTDVSEITSKGRGGGGVRVTKFGGENRVDFAYVGSEAGLILIVGAEDSPSRPDPNPEPMTVPHTGRDLASKKVPRRYLAAGLGRW